MAHYGKVEFWEERYSKSLEPFDWYQVYAGIKDVITQYMNKSDKILNVGAGNSRLSEDMYEEGYEQITNIDISHTVISHMREKCLTRCPKMEYKKMDVLDMSEINSASFNAVIDKGTLDCILCGDNSVPNAEKMMQEIHRLLVPGGVYICISYGDEEHRKKFFNTQNWEIFVDKVAKPSTIIASSVNSDEKDPKNFHYIYNMVKPK